jgi:hypothetical protein
LVASVRTLLALMGAGREPRPVIEDRKTSSGAWVGQGGERQSAMAWRCIVAVVSLATALAFASASAQSRAPIFYSGALTKQSVRDIEANLKGSSSDALVLTSPGGDPDASMELGGYLRTHNIHLAVRRYCLSACAQYVFVAANPTIEPNGIVAFSGSSSVLYFALSKREPVVANQLYGPYKNRELSYYANIGVSPALLFMPYLTLSPICSGIIYQNGRAVSSYISVHGELFIPSPEQLRGYGVRFSGHPPTSPDELKAALAASWRGPSHHWAGGVPKAGPTNVSDMERRLAALPACRTAAGRLAMRTAS